jgi:hypothetical protein
MDEYFVFISFFIWLGILTVFSFFVDYLLARIFSKGAHRFFVFLGVIVHEYSHAFGCLITRTKISEIKLFEESGGHVTHQKRNPFITSIIGMMPLFGCSVFLILLAFIFGYVGVLFPSTGFALNNLNFLNAFGGILIFAGKTFYINIIQFNHITILFFIFLYFVGSVAAAIAPSTVDLKHSALGLIIIIILGLVVIFVQPLGYIPGVKEHFNSATPVLDFIVEQLSIAISIGMIGIFLILMILIPVALLKRR